MTIPCKCAQMNTKKHHGMWNSREKHKNICLWCQLTLTHILGPFLEWNYAQGTHDQDVLEARWLPFGLEYLVWLENVGCSLIRLQGMIRDISDLTIWEGIGTVYSTIFLFVLLAGIVIWYLARPVFEDGHVQIFPVSLHAAIVATCSPKRVTRNQQHTRMLHALHQNCKSFIAGWWCVCTAKKNSDHI